MPSVEALRVDPHERDGEFSTIFLTLLVSVFEESFIQLSGSVAEGLFWIAVVACAIAQAALLRSAFRTPVGGTARANAMRHRAPEIAWAVLPALMLALVLALTWRKMHEAPAHEHHAPVANTPLIRS